MTGRCARLGLRLLRPTDRNSAVRLLVAVAGTLIGTVAILALLSIPGVVDRQAERLGGQQPEWWRGDGVVEPGDAVPLLIRSSSEEVDGRVVTRRVVAVLDDDTAQRPDWIPRWPAPGEMVISPALAQAIAADPGGLGRRFPQTAVAIIPDSGLIGPDQLVAIVGVDESALASDQPRVRGATGIGRDQPSHEGPDPRVVRLFATGGAVFVGLPTLVLVATTARLSARSRQRRLAALRLVGLSSRQTRLINSIETAAMSLIGALGGVAVWRLLIPVSEPIGVGPVRWFAEDVGVPGAAIVMVVAVLVVASTAVSVAGSAASIIDPLAERRSAPDDAPSPWRFAPLGLGLALLIVTAIWTEPALPNLWFAAFIGGNVLAGLGIYLAMPLLARVIGWTLAARPTSPAATLAGRRLVHDPTAVARVASGLLAVMLVAGLGQAMIVVLDWAINRNLADIGDAPVLVSTDSTLPAAELAALDGVQTVVREFVVDAEVVSVVVATCEELGSIARIEGAECTDNAAQQLRTSGVPPLPMVSYGAALDVEAVALNGATSSLADVKIPPAMLPADLPQTAPRWTIELDSPASVRGFTNALIGRDPVTAVDGVPSLDRGRLASTYRALVNAATAAAIVISITATTATIVDRTLERRRTANQLLALGVPGPVLRRAEALWIAGPLALGIGLAATTGLLAGAAWIRFGNEGIDLPAFEIGTVLALGAFATVAASVGTAWATPIKLQGRIESDAL